MKTWRYLFTLIFPFALFLYITVNVLHENTVVFDDYIYSMVSKIISEKLTPIMIFITFFASSNFLTAIAVLLVPFLFLKNERYSFYAAVLIVNLVVTSLLNEGLKLLISRSRPNILRLIEVSGLSFPSGHAMSSMCFYGFLIYLCCKNLKTKIKYLIICLLIILIFLIGFSRIYLGVHYASDVMGGFSIGLFLVGILSLVVEMKYRKNLQN